MVEHARAYSNHFGTAAATALVALGLVVVPPEKASSFALRTEVAAVQLQAAVATQVSGIVNSLPAAAAESVGQEVVLTEGTTGSTPFTDLIGTVVSFAIGAALLAGTPILLPIAVIASPLVNPLLCAASLGAMCSNQDPITGYFNFVLSFFQPRPVGSAAAIAPQNPAAATASASTAGTTRAAQNKAAAASDTSASESLDPVARGNPSFGNGKSQAHARPAMTTDRQSPGATPTPPAATAVPAEASSNPPELAEAASITPTKGIEISSDNGVALRPQERHAAHGAATQRSARRHG